ncbi:glycerophosphodiester phosphodiesterase [Streptomyces sp. LBUM 1478]|uniref:glycerophosphodiester phosphodiesterase n=7 Tax=Streptomyces scabiei TaxID=1930 RepID=UPI000765A4BF|nr:MULTISPECIES: glycerophosphodiester phosphodiesterase [Streptomyces]MBP5908556.1 glycerophosphodiester phosphodiesterase [Streptomyces sp. LBUM 1478]MBP5878740.1 glycerophosphodiester phosphodiesterase [Streptomyces sp. LBUM 1477]MBP5886578.1 glycerophosphodiester phosphodiesterase [Streptomyces sp. LBUM 1487]MBP5890727.1 glycerophosphodiester phosphodiesterase [Streptomyces sp. LBUM 1481]MBP5902570.1 glycerophosphodiester phosphodiesterase [Streptomyces sp. LBUM 1488]
MRTVTAVAHRGAPYRHRENTLDSLRAGLGLGADAVEFDVRTTRDGVPVLLHDSTLDRLWKVERPLSALSAAELSGLTAGGVPTLADALLATGDSRVMVDLPGAVNRRAVRRVLDVVREHEAEERVYYSADPPTLLAVRAAAPTAELALTWKTLAPPRPALLDAVRPRWLNYRFGLVTGPLVDRVHRNGHLLSVWTPDTRRSMRRLMELGVDSITTNRVDTLCALRRQPTHGGTGAESSPPSRTRP